jgi:hypothetical protein
MTNKLEELFKISCKNNYQFQYNIINEKDNLFNLDEENKIVKITIGDPEHEDLIKLIDEIIIKIKGDF